jgi:hypothetical protein
MGRFRYGAIKLVEGFTKFQIKGFKLMHGSVEDFLNELEALKEELFLDARLEIVYSRFNRASVRMHLDASSFIDMYCNVENGRFDFSLIHSGKRICGYDNLTEWHYHPVNNPRSHLDCNEPTLRQILEEMAAVMQTA